MAVDGEPPVVDKIRVFYNHPSFIEANADRLRSALQQLPVDRQKSARIAFTAHSIPQSMADSCDYALQLEETCRLVSDSLEVKSENWQLVYQSRSGRPSDPWLEPDILDYLTTVAGADATDVVIMPIGFLSDHVEVLYDLDYEAQNKCSQLGLRLVRAATVGTHPIFVSMLRELIQERMTDNLERRSIGRFAASHDCCPDDCCLYPIVQRAPVEPNKSDSG
jgi:ferrochelatase